MFEFLAWTLLFSFRTGSLYKRSRLQKFCTKEDFSVGILSAIPRRGLANNLAKKGIPSGVALLTAELSYPGGEYAHLLSDLKWVTSVARDATDSYLYRGTTPTFLDALQRILPGTWLTLIERAATFDESSSIYLDMLNAFLEIENPVDDIPNFHMSSEPIADRLEKRGAPRSVAEVVSASCFPSGIEVDTVLFECITSESHAQSLVERWLSSVEVSFKDTLTELFGDRYLDVLRHAAEVAPEEAWLYDMFVFDEHDGPNSVPHPHDEVLTTASFLVHIRDVFEGILDSQPVLGRTDDELQSEVTAMHIAAMKTLYYMPIWQSIRSGHPSFAECVVFVAENTSPWVEFVSRAYYLHPEWKLNRQQCVMAASATYTSIQYLVNHLDDEAIQSRLKEIQPHRSHIERLIRQA